VRIFLHGAVNKRKVDNAPWSDCRNKNVFSDRLNREYDNSAFRRSAGKLFHTLVAFSSRTDPV